MLINISYSSILSFLVSWIIVISATTANGQYDKNSCPNLKICLYNKDTITIDFCSAYLKATESKAELGFGLYYIFEKGDIKAIDIEFSKTSKNNLIAINDTSINVLVVVAFNRNTGELFDSHIIRAPLFYTLHNTRGLNTMAALYGGVFKGITGIKANKALQKIYIDSFYSNLTNQNFSVLIDYYVYHKDTIALHSLITKAIQTDTLQKQEYQYASLFAKRFLKDVNLGYVLDSLANGKDSINLKWETLYKNGLNSGKSKDYIEALISLQLNKPLNENEISKEINIKIAISKSMASEGEKITEILKWRPDNITNYQYWTNYIPIVTISAGKSSKDDLDIKGWLNILEDEIIQEELKLTSPPQNLLRHQYRSNLKILLEGIAEAYSILNGKMPYFFDDLSYQKKLLINYPTNGIIQLSYFKLSKYFKGTDSAITEINALIGAESFSKILKDTIAMTNNMLNEPKNPLVGKDLSKFEFEDITGKKIKIEKFNGNIVVIDLWATWCLPCIQSMPSINKIKEFFIDKNVQFLMLNYYEEKRKMDAINFLFQKGFSHESMIFDGSNKSLESYGVSSIPTTIILNNHGIVVDIIQGFDINNSDKFEQSVSVAIKKILF